MSYRDPYAAGQQQYQDAPFNPYEVQHQQAARGYDQGGYQGYEGYAEQDPSGRMKETSAFDHDEPIPAPLGEKTPGNVRRWRTEYQGNLWTKGSRAGCFGRFFCCTVMMFFFFLISIILSLALWIRPPNIIIDDPTPDLSTFTANSTTFSISLPVVISVNNPNYFTVKLQNLDATVVYPINNTNVGSGHMSDIKFEDHTQTNFTFPVTIDYDSNLDPDGAVLKDLVSKCTSDSQVSVTVDIKLGLEILFVAFTVPITRSVSFACNLSNDESELENILKGLGFSTSALSSILR